jgi:hypothetical protein
VRRLTIWPGNHDPVIRLAGQVKGHGRLAPMADREGNTVKVRGEVPDGACDTVPTVLTAGHRAGMSGPWTSASSSGTTRARTTAVRGTAISPGNAYIFSVTDRAEQATVTVPSSISTLGTQLIVQPGQARGCRVRVALCR